MSMHSFDPEVAAEVGVVPAVIYSNLLFWVMRNAAEAEMNDKGDARRHFHDGRWWTYNSVSALARLYPYLTQDQIRRALEKLESAALVVVGNFHADRFRRAKWYSPIRPADLVKIENAVGENAKRTSGEDAEQSGNFAESYTDRKPHIKTEDTAPAPADAPPTASKYRWQGDIIRLTEKDFDRWASSFRAIDLPAELASLDAWLSSRDATDQHRRGWFHVTAGALKNRNDAARSKPGANAVKPKRPQSTDMMELCYGPEFG